MSAHNRHPLPIDTCFGCFEVIGPHRPAGAQTAKDDDMIIVCKRCVAKMCDRAHLQQLLDDVMNIGYILGYHASHKEAGRRRSRSKRATDAKARQRRASIKVLSATPPAPDGDKSQT